MTTSKIRRAPAKARRRSRSEWLAEVTDWRASGEDASSYSARQGINPRTLAWWASQLRDETRPRAARAAAPPRLFVAVREASRPDSSVAALASNAATGSIEITLVNGLRLRVIGDVSAEMLGRVLDVTQGDARC